jgi:hypothetical protein
MDVEIDHIDGVRFSETDAPTLNYQELYNLRAGILWLHGQVLPLEEKMRREGLTFGMGWPFFDEYLMSCFFHWFAVSLVNHCRLVGTMDFLRRRGLKDSALLDPKNAERSARHTKDYVKRVCPDVLHWRDKVSAHFSLTDVRENDTIGGMRTGVSMNVGFTQDRVRTAALRWDNASLPSWSLTEEVQRLAPRYWPDFKVHSPFAINA